MNRERGWPLVSPRLASPRLASTSSDDAPFRRSIGRGPFRLPPPPPPLHHFTHRRRRRRTVANERCFIYLLVFIEMLFQTTLGGFDGFRDPQTFSLKVKTAGEKESRQSQALKRHSRRRRRRHCVLERNGWHTPFHLQNNNNNNNNYPFPLSRFTCPINQRRGYRQTPSSSSSSSSALTSSSSSASSRVTAVGMGHLSPTICQRRRRRRRR